MGHELRVEERKSKSPVDNMLRKSMRSSLCSGVAVSLVKLFRNVLLSRVSFCNRRDDLITSLIFFTFSYHFLAVVHRSSHD